MTDPSHWAYDAVFYHIYPLGACGAPPRNDFTSQPVPRFARIEQWIPHLCRLGVNALYLGPVFESTAHGYDTANYYEVDRRLGDRQTLANLSAQLHRNGIRLILDGVFNHVGRDFWAFRDVQMYGEASRYKDWFDGLRFDACSPYGDPFTYQPWNGHYDLVRLNQQHPDVRAHLFDAVRMWVDEFNIAGLRLDVADCLDPDFMHALRKFTEQLRPDFWLMGEVVHEDYRRWVNPDTLHSVTNYECYKGLYSSLADKNYFEIAYALNRQFAPSGQYAGLPLYNFADNHDVNRVASNLVNPALLYPLYLLLFSMPGVPSIYYGSEWGLEGKRTCHSDSALRPVLDLELLQRNVSSPQLVDAISRFASLRHTLPALRHGSYGQLHVAHEQFVFARYTDKDYVVILLNAADSPASLDIGLPRHFNHAIDVLNHGESFTVQGGKLHVEKLHPHWGRIMRLEI
jgi:cyclomaltodextrinase / maltogenic alpha-amylase / neopullulanase